MYELDIENAISRCRRPSLQQGNRDVINRSSASGLAFQLPVMRVPVNHQVSPVPVHDLRQARRTQKRTNLGRFPLHRSRNRRLVQHNHSLRGAELRHGAFQLDSLIDRNLYESLQFRLPESR